MKARPPDTNPQNRKEPAATRRHSPSSAALQEQLDQRTRDLAETRKQLAEALEQQTATSEVLQVISTSPGKLEPVFEALLANAMRICKARFGHLLLYDGESFHAGHLHDVPPSYREVIGARANTPWSEHRSRENQTQYRASAPLAAHRIFSRK